MGSSVHRFWFIGSLVLTVAAPAQKPTAVALLDRYERGDHAGVVEAFLSVRDVGDLRKDLERNGLAWTRAAGAGAETRRRMVAATVALELARVRLEDEWRELRSLVEWGCELVRRGAPTEVERLWQLAALAVSQGALDAHVLFKLGGVTKSYGHLAHARNRFPDEPRFALAERFAVTRIMGGRGEPGLDVTMEPDADSKVADAPSNLGRPIVMSTGSGGGVDAFASEALARRNAADARMARESSLRRLREMFEDPTVGPEAALRAGHLLLIGLELEPALEAFHVANRSSASPYVKYLAHFLRGRVLERLDRPAEAERAYAAAADTVPQAQSAALARASLLMRAGRTAEAHELTRASFDAKPRPPDPWRLFPYGDYYRLPALIGELRKAVGP